MLVRSMPPPTPGGAAVPAALGPPTGAPDGVAVNGVLVLRSATLIAGLPPVNVVMVSGEIVAEVGCALGGNPLPSNPLTAPAKPPAPAAASNPSAPSEGPAASPRALTVRADVAGASASPVACVNNGTASLAAPSPAPAVNSPSPLAAAGTSASPAAGASASPIA